SEADDSPEEDARSCANGRSWSSRTVRRYRPAILAALRRCVPHLTAEIGLHLECYVFLFVQVHAFRERLMLTIPSMFPSRPGLRPPQPYIDSSVHRSRLEAEVSFKLLKRCSRPERLHTDRSASRADISLPPKSRGLLHCDARRDRGWQDAVPVLLCLAI